MSRFVVRMMCLGLCSTTVHAGHEFSISGSSTDPFEATSTPANGLESPYLLWMICGDAGLAAVETLGFAGASGCSSDSAQGLVIGYGAEVAPPYEFSGVGGDTLYLNELPYLPRRRPVEPNIVPRDVLELSESRYSLSQSVLASVISMPDGEERWEAYAAGMRAATLVASATVIAPGQVAIVWADGTTAVDFIQKVQSITEPAPSGSSEERHNRFMAQFQSVMGMGGVVAFGESYFTRSGDPEYARRSREIIRQYEAGTLRNVPDENFYRGSIFQNAVLRKAILR